MSGANGWAFPVADPVVMRGQQLAYRVEGVHSDVTVTVVEDDGVVPRCQPAEVRCAELDDEPPGTRCAEALRKHATCSSWMSRLLMVLKTR